MVIDFCALHGSLCFSFFNTTARLISGTNWPCTSALLGSGQEPIFPYMDANSVVITNGFDVLLGGSLCYNGLLLKKCIDNSTYIETCPDIGYIAFGIPVESLYWWAFTDSTDLCKSELFYC